MDYEAYRKKYFSDPQPLQRYGFVGIHGLTLFFEEFDDAVDYYSQVLGSPAYSEGEFTRGWRLGDTWLTLLKGRGGSPGNVEVSILMESSAEAERLQFAFIEAGRIGPDPSDQLMYDPVRSCPVSDPFGTQIMIYAHLKE